MLELLTEGSLGQVAAYYQVTVTFSFTYLSSQDLETFELYVRVKQNTIKNLSYTEVCFSCLHVYSACVQLRF